MCIVGIIMLGIFPLDKINRLYKNQNCEDIVIHGAIDSFSRLIPFLERSTKNRKETVTRLFLSGIETYGISSRIRIDRRGKDSDM